MTSSTEEEQAFQDDLTQLPTADHFEVEPDQLVMTPYLPSIESHIKTIITKLNNKSQGILGSVSNDLVINPPQGLIVVMMSLTDLYLNEDKQSSPGEIKICIGLDLVKGDPAHCQNSIQVRRYLYDTYGYLMPALAETVEQNLNSVGSVLFIINYELTIQSTDSDIKALDDEINSKVQCGLIHNKESNKSHIQQHAMAVLKENVLQLV